MDKNNARLVIEENRRRNEPFINLSANAYSNNNYPLDVCATTVERTATYFPNALFIMNMSILFPPNTAFILSSNRISFLLLGFCNWFFLI